MDRLRIALFVSEFEDPFTDVLCKGAVKAAKEKGYDLYIFPSKFLDSKKGRVMDSFGYQNNCLFQFACKENVDIAIINTGNIAADLDAHDKQFFLDRISVPVLLISDAAEGYPRVNFENCTGFAEGIEHLIQHHGKKKFGFVSGPRHNADAAERYEIFVDTMKRNGITPEQYRIVEGDFSYNCTDVIEELLDAYPEMEAMVCANDMMCYGAYTVLEERKIRIGEDIAVMGFDDSQYSKELRPGLSTVKADPALLGYEAVCLCESALQGKIEERLVHTTFVQRESCGCPAPLDEEDFSDMISVKAHLDALNHTLVSISKNVLDYEEENNEIYPMILNSLCNINLHSVYLYTFERVREYKRGQFWERPEYVRLRAYFREKGRRKPEVIYQPMPLYYYPIGEDDIKEVKEREQQTIPFEQIFANAYYQDEKPSVRIVTLLYAGESQYGFLIWEIDEEYFSYIGQLSYQIANALKTNRLLQKKGQMAVRLKESLQQVEEKNSILEEISKVDELTQIYNRRGFLDNMKHRVIDKENEGKRAVAIYADMNNLKLVNDQFGHEEGDYALRAIGQILHETIHGMKGQGEIGRIGGDEFCAYLITDAEDSEERIRRKIEEVTEDLNRNNDKPYYVSMSVGMKHFVCSSETDISYELEQADGQLYEYKKKKRKSILK